MVTNFNLLFTKTILIIPYNPVLTEKVRLEPGLHCYPFECQLKMLMPTSLEEAHGSIRYTARIRFDEFWDSEPVHEETFTIIKPLHLNMLPSLHVTNYC